MKTRFSTYDLICSVTELQKLIGLRVVQVYDIDNKTYLIKLQRTEEKCILLLESGVRLHTTASEWPKNVAPSGFSMKMRKHLRNKRLEVMTQLGRDRIVDLQFGTGEAAYHVILELYDRGNIILTDCDMTIINILRPHTEGEEVRFAVREKYPTDRAQQINGVPSVQKLIEIMANAKTGDPLKKILNPHLDYGSALIDHVMLGAGFPTSCKLGKTFDLATDLSRLAAALQEAEELMVLASKQVSKGFITQKREQRPSQDGEEQELLTNQEFHPTLMLQHEQLPYQEFDTFDVAVDEFFSAVESQKIDLKALQQEREAMKKLSNVRKDHDLRLRGLERTQETDRRRAELITGNHSLVDRAILSLRAALAKQLAWKDIETLVKDAQAEGDVVACHIQALKLDSNKITMSLSDPYIGENSSEEDDDARWKPTLIDINLDLTAYANATRYYDQKRTAAKKQQKTIDAQGKALKSAERKTKQTLKEVQAITTISKARKVYWFEKFFWFISSENYLVIGGRDQVQNEMIVKRYMRAADVYVHADIQGASSLVVKNPSGAPIPPKTLNEAGIMAVSYSVAWEAKVVTSAWWVQSEQVSKTAPTGEYLTTGSFMIRGKKNYLPPCHLIMGFSFLFKLEESSVFRHKDERKVKGVEEDLQLSETDQEDNEIELLEDDEELQGENNDEQGETLAVEDGSEDEGEEVPRFPDTEVRIEHVQGDRVALHTTAMPLLRNPSVNSEEDNVVYLGDDKPVLLKPSGGRQRNRSETKHKNSLLDPDECQTEKSAEKQAQPKRGQKSKLKKIKEKYADQDEEERMLRMEILQSSGTAKEKKGKKKKEQGGGKGEKGPAVPKQKKPAPAPKVGGGEDSGGEEEPTVNTDMDMLVALTGQPVTEDEILFAIPVVAPYNVLLNYKYKVKLTPGTGKRGKAARTAVMMFLKDRGITSREKDVIRSVKDELLARNLPGKVKLSAPQMQRLRK